MSLPLSAGHFVGPPAIIPRKNRMSLRRSSYRAYYKLRRLLMTLVGLLLSTAVMELCTRQDRIIWMHPRSSNWWKDVVLQSFGPTDWLDNFRVSCETFNYLKATDTNKNYSNEETCVSSKACCNHALGSGHTFRIPYNRSPIWNSKMYSVCHCQRNL